MSVELSGGKKVSDWSDDVNRSGWPTGGAPLLWSSRRVTVTSPVSFPAHLSFPLALEVQLGAKLQKIMKKKKRFFWSVSTDCVGMGETQCKVTTFPPPIPWRKVRTWKPQATVSTCQLSDDNDKQNEYFTWQSNLSIECVWLCRAQLQSITFKHGKWSKVWVGEEKESQISSESKIESCLSGEYFHCQ